MLGDTELAALGKLIGDRGRSAMLLALLADRPMSASALADAAGVSRPLASVHLRKLVDGGLVVVEPAGRQRLYRLANVVADAVEGLLLLAGPEDAPSLRGVREGEGLRRARLCYDHLAGAVGVQVYDAMRDRGLLQVTEAENQITGAGTSAFGELGIDVAALQTERRPLLRACMDWSERRHHLAGSLGASFIPRLIELEWLQVQEASRAVMITQAGRNGLSGWLGVRVG